MSGCGMTLRPRPRAMPSIVMSSCVGPTPPEVNTTSYVSWQLRTSCAMTSSSSGITATRLSATPRPRSSPARNGEFVSVTFPDRISLPIMTAAAVSSAIATSDGHRAFAEFAHPEPDVDERRLAGAERALERGTDLARLLDVLAVPAQRLDDAVVAREIELGRDRALLAIELHLAAADLHPRRVVADDADDVDLLPHAGLELHAVQAEGAVAVHDEHVAVRPRELRRHRVSGTDAERAERARIEPLTDLGDAEHRRRGRDEVAAVADDDRVLVEHVVDRLAEPQRVDRRGVRRHLRQHLLEACRFLDPQLAHPFAHGAAAAGRAARERRELRHDEPRVADDADVDVAVAADLAAVEVDLDELRLRIQVARPPVAETEVERRTEDQDHVGGAERVLAGAVEVVRVVGRQRAARLAVHVDGEPKALDERLVRVAPLRPEELAADERDRPLRVLEELGRALDVLRIAADRRSGARPGRELDFRLVDAVEEEIDRHLEEDRPGDAGRRDAKRGRDVLGETA